MEKLQYVRTDRNGTKIYYDWICPRCGGAGEAQKWEYTGRICYGCGGTGKRPKPKTVKRYTPEYAEKLRKRQEERERKRLLKNPPPTEEEKRKKAWKGEGFQTTGAGFLHIGETYENKDSLKAAGGKWNIFLKGYIAPEPIEGLKGIEIQQVDASELCNEYGYIDSDKAYEYRQELDKENGRG
ncbi:MAG: hypothetical protein Q4C63_08130 [Eubacteriales bacterium]|nr:hypothetical protein [Eubacteriales bacterium]